MMIIIATIMITSKDNNYICILKICWIYIHWMIWHINIYINLLHTSSIHCTFLYLAAHPMNPK